MRRFLLLVLLFVCVAGCTAGKQRISDHTGMSKESDVNASANLNGGSYRLEEGSSAQIVDLKDKSAKYFVSVMDEVGKETQIRIQVDGRPIHVGEKRGVIRKGGGALVEGTSVRLVNSGERVRGNFSLVGKPDGFTSFFFTLGKNDPPYILLASLKEPHFFRLTPPGDINPARESIMIYTEDSVYEMKDNSIDFIAKQVVLKREYTSPPPGNVLDLIGIANIFYKGIPSEIQ